MPADDRLDDILDAWQEAFERGAEVPAAELCRSAPDLLPEAERRIALLRRVAALRPAAVGRTLSVAAASSDTATRGFAVPAAPVGDGPPGYELLGELGRGGMGVVYKARQVGLNRVVALKMVLGGARARPADLARFRTEGEAVARVGHPNIVQIHEVGAHAGSPYLVLEYCPGGSLDARLADAPLAPQAAAELVRALARAVHHAHEAGVVHRDLKPANVLLAADGTPKVADFGLAKWADAGDGATATGAVLGTPSYMAPEQASGEVKAVDRRADVYALGAILYACLTGRAPFKGTSALDTLDQVRRAEPPAVRVLQSGVPRDLETVCHTCLQKAADRRYPSAAALADELDRFLAGRPISARPVGPAEQAWRWCRRNPAVAVLLAAVLVASAGGAGASMYFAAAESQRAGEAEQARLAATDALQKEEEARRTAQAALAAADDARDAAQRQVVRLDVATAAQLADRGDHDEALHWIARAWADDRARLGPGRASAPGEDADHRLRVGAALERLPRLVGFCPHDRPVQAADCDPTGLRVVALLGDHLARVWAADRAEPAFPPLEHGGPVTSAVFSADGHRLATSSQDGTARVWDAATGESRHTFRPGAPVVRVAFSPDGQTLAATTAGAVHRWDLTTGEERPPLRVGARLVYVAFSPNGGKLLTVGTPPPAAGAVPFVAVKFTRSIRVWDAATGEPLCDWLAHPKEGYAELMWPTFSADGTKVWANGADGMYVCDLAARSVRHVPLADWHGDTARAAAFSPNGSALIHTARPEAFLRVTPLGGTAGRLSMPTGRMPYGVAVRPDGRRAAVAVAGRVQFYDLVAGTQDRVPVRQQNSVTALRYTPDGRRLLVATSDGTVRVWEFPDTAPPEAYRHDCGRADRLREPARRYSPDGRWVADYSPERGAVLVGRAGGPLAPLPRRFAALDVLFSPDGRHLVTRSEPVNGRPVVESWRLTDAGPEPVAAVGAPDARLTRFGFSADGRRLAAAVQTAAHQPSLNAEGDAGGLWTFPALEPIAPWGGPLRVRFQGEPALNRDGSLLAFREYTPGKALACWDTATGAAPADAELASGLIDSLDFGAVDGRLLVSLTDRTLRQVDPRTGRRLGPTIPHLSTTGNSAAAYSPDQRWIAQVVIRPAPGGVTRHVHLHSADTGALLAEHPLGPSAPDHNARVWFSADGARVIAHYPQTGATEVWRLPRFAAPPEHLPALARLLTGLTPNPDGGFLPLEPGEMFKNRDTYIRTFRTWKGLPPVS